MEHYRFTPPIAEATVALMKRKGDKTIMKPEDIAGKTIGEARRRRSSRRPRRTATSCRAASRSRNMSASTKPMPISRRAASWRSAIRCPTSPSSPSRSPTRSRSCCRPFGVKTYFGFIDRKDADYQEPRRRRRRRAAEDQEGRPHGEAAAEMVRHVVRHAGHDRRATIAASGRVRRRAASPQLTEPHGLRRAASSRTPGVPSRSSTSMTLALRPARQSRALHACSSARSRSRIGFSSASAWRRRGRRRTRGSSWPARAYVSFFRGVPLLVQLLLIYNLLPAIGINVPSVVAAISGLALCTSAYQAENLRGGFLSVPRGLLESADMLGLTPWQQLVRIRAPIAFRLTLPAVVNEAILILKASSLVSVVGVVELTRMAQDLDTSLYKPIQLYSCAGAALFPHQPRRVGLRALWLERRLIVGARGEVRLRAGPQPSCPTSSRALGVTIGVWIAAWSAPSRSASLVAVGAPLRPALAQRRCCSPMSSCSAARRSWCNCSCSISAAPMPASRSTRCPPGLLALSVYGGAYFSEVFRAGFEAVPRGHVEAAECVGLFARADRRPHSAAGNGDARAARRAQHRRSAC